MNPAGDLIAPMFRGSQLCRIGTQPISPGQSRLQPLNLASQVKGLLLVALQALANLSQNLVEIVALRSSSSHPNPPPVADAVRIALC
jgi:hypothetical protein